jgi:hypothetical protein
MTRSVAARQLRQLRSEFYEAPPRIRKLFRRWLVAECKEISACAPRFWRH